MPIEYALLKDQPCPIVFCPECYALFWPLMRGEVQRSKRWLWGLGPKRDYCALICGECKEIVGYESPPTVEPDPPGVCVACGRTQAEFDDNNRGLTSDDFDYLEWADNTRTLCCSCEDYPDGP